LYLKKEQFFRGTGIVWILFKKKQPTPPQSYSVWIGMIQLI